MDTIVELFPEELERVTGGDRGFVMPSGASQDEGAGLAGADADRAGRVTPNRARPPGPRGLTA